jgi:hypothetical protein
VNRDDQVAAFHALRETVKELATLADEIRLQLVTEREPWTCHPDYPERISAELARASRCVSLAGAEFRRTLIGGRASSATVPDEPASPEELG